MTPTQALEMCKELSRKMAKWAGRRGGVTGIETGGDRCARKYQRAECAAEYLYGELEMAVQGVMKRESWECTKCGSPCWVDIDYTDSEYVEPGTQRFRELCICGRAKAPNDHYPEWRRTRGGSSHGQ